MSLKLDRIDGTPVVPQPEDPEVAFKKVTPEGIRPTTPISQSEQESNLGDTSGDGSEKAKLGRILQMIQEAQKKNKEIQQSLTFRRIDKYRQVAQGSDEKKKKGTKLDRHT